MTELQQVTLNLTASEINTARQLLGEKGMPSEAVTDDVAVETLIRYLADTRSWTFEPLLTVNDVCALLSISRQTVYRLIHDGDITPIRVSQSPRFAPNDLRRYVERQTEQR
jgi:excisionase family DNA binding protein